MKFLLISPQGWGKIFVSKHHYAVELAEEGHEVFFVNPPNLVSKLSINFRVEKSSEYQNLYFISYNVPKVIYFFRFHFRPLFDIYVKLLILPLIKKIGKIDFVWCYEPNIFASLERIDAKRKLFFIVDQPSGKQLRSLIGSCDAIVSVSHTILNSFEVFDKPKLLLNHGLGKAFEKYALQKLEGKLTDKPSERIKVGYVGNLLIGDVFDTEIFKTIIDENDSIEFHFWGSYQPDHGSIVGQLTPKQEKFIFFLKQRQNVVLHGPTHPKNLAEEIQEVDAFVLVYNSAKDINKGSNSHKIIEYLSTGKVIISTYISMYDKQSGLLEMLNEDSNVGLVSKFNEVVSNLDYFNRDEAQQRRIKFALNNSYSNHIQTINAFLEAEVNN